MKKIKLMPGDGQKFWKWYLSHWCMTNKGIKYSPKSKANLD